jgi:DNA-binding transcriptional MocR family regulator
MEHLETYRESVIGIKRTATGIDLLELERIFREEDIKFFYTIPRFHNPLGTSYSKKDKEEIAKLAEKYDVYIVEDDYLADFEQDSKEDPIYTYDINDYVIYLKSYSKIIFPGLRIGLAVLPNQLTKQFLHHKKINDIESSTISQAALEIYIKSGMFERHNQKIRASYVSRAKLLYQSLKKYTDNNSDLVKIIQPSSLCMHAHIVLHKSINMQQLIRNLRKQSVLLDTINRNYLSTFQQEKILKLNVSNVEEHKIEEGVRRVVEEIRRLGSV